MTTAQSLAVGLASFAATALAILAHHAAMSGGVLA